VSNSSTFYVRVFLYENKLHIFSLITIWLGDILAKGYNIPLFWPQNDSRQQSYIINLFFYNKRFYRIDSRLINNFRGKMDSSSSHEFDFKLITHLQCLHDFSYCNTNFTIQFCTKSLHRFTDEYYNPIVIIYSLAFWHRNDIVKLETKDLNVFSRTYLTVLIFRKRIIFVKNFHLNFTVF